MTLAVIEYGSSHHPNLRSRHHNVSTAVVFCLKQRARHIFHHPDANPAFIQQSNGGCQLSQTLGGAAFGCSGEGVVFSYEWAATPLPADGTALVKLGQTLPCLSLWSFEPRGNISDGAVSEEVLRAWALVGCSRCCSYGCCCPSLLLVPCRGDQEVGGLCCRSLLLLLEPLTGAPGPVPDSSVCHSHPPTLAILRPTGCCLQLADRHLQSSHCDCG